MKRVKGYLAAVVPMLVSFSVATAGLTVVDAKLGKGVQNREIVGETASFAVNEKAYLLLRVTGGPGELEVTWSHGDHSETIPLNVGGNPWRTWANKTLWTAGDWKVTVTDGDGQMLEEISFQVR